MSRLEKLFRYINEYADGGTPSGHASGDHWHLTWSPGANTNDGKAALDAAIKRQTDGDLWYKNALTGKENENKSKFIISVSAPITANTNVEAASGAMK